MRNLSVVLATRNEEKNIKDCLESVRNIADEIIVVDENSTDQTREIAEQCGAKVYKVKHEPIFHITKQKALNKATGEWILQLDADERVSKNLSKEIAKVVEMSDSDLQKYEVGDAKKKRLFLRHEKLIEKRDGKTGERNGEVVAFFIPRVNYFIGRPLIHAGVYPDGVIRLVKNGKARFPQKSVHEQIEIDGEVRWLENDLEHHDSPTIRRYLERMNRYTDLHSQELNEKKIPKNITYFFVYTIFKPVGTFFRLFVRHKGFMDGISGFLWSMFSAMHFPLAYYKYREGEFNR